MFYRKYRSQTIEEIDNSAIRESLGINLLNNKFSSAYLLLGTRGSGKTSTARLIAKIVNCTGRKLGEDVCGKCESCIEITEGRSLDLIEIDAASNTGVEDIRELREKVKLSPIKSNYKIYIIDEVHMLSTSAFNALLKTLEEPPARVIFVLATTESHKVPATIVSRCMVYDFKKAVDDDIKRSLERVVKGEGLEVEGDTLSKVVKMAKGSFRDAQKILEQLVVDNKISVTDVERISVGGNDSALDLLKAIFDSDKRRALEVIEGFAEKQGKIEDFYESIFSAIRTMLLSKNGFSSWQHDISFSDHEIRELLEKLVKASSLSKTCSIAHLPLESIVLEFIEKGKKEVAEDKKNDKSETAKRVGEERGEKVELKVEEKKSDEKKVAVNAEKEEERVEKVTQKPESKEKEEELPTGEASSKIEDVLSHWNDILAAAKPYNHSLVAFLRGSKPSKMVGNCLVMEVFYKFHRDKLSEAKNKEIFESVVSGVLKENIRVKFELASKE